MIVSTPDGDVEFPDSMSSDDIKGVLQKKYGFKSDKDITGGAYTYDTGGGWLAALHNLAVKSNNITREAADAYTYHGLDALQGLLPGSPSTANLRAQTAASGQDLGPYAKAAIDAVARTANPVSRVGTGGVLSTAASGAAQEATAAALHGDDPVAAGIVGGLTGGTIGVAGKYPAVAANYLRRWGVPAAAGVAGSTFGPWAGMAATQAAQALTPAAKPITESTFFPWVNPGVNAAVQGALSGQQDMLDKLTK